MGYRTFVCILGIIICCASLVGCNGDNANDGQDTTEIYIADGGK